MARYSARSLVQSSTINHRRRKQLDGNSEIASPVRDAQRFGINLHKGFLSMFSLVLCFYDELSIMRYSSCLYMIDDNYGWNRIMIHLLVQQVVRQSPAYCMLYVALQKYRNYRLVSYPYYTNFQEKSDKTCFRHMDLNIPRLVNLTRFYFVLMRMFELQFPFLPRSLVILPLIEYR